MDTGLNSYEHEVYKHKRKKLGIFNSSCSVGSQYGDGGDSDVVECPEFIVPGDGEEPVVRIRYTSTDDLTVLTPYAIGGIASIIDNSDGTYDLISYDACTFISLSSSVDSYTSLNITEIDVLIADTLKKVVGETGNKAEDAPGTFAPISALTSFTWNGDMNLESMDFMLGMNTGLTSLDLSTFDTSKVTSMRYSFAVTGLTSLDTSALANSNNVDMVGLFFQCAALTCITELDTTNATDKFNMLTDCPALVQPDAAAQADLIDSNGADWLNPNSCP